MFCLFLLCLGNISPDISSLEACGARTPDGNGVTWSSVVKGQRGSSALK